MRKESELRAELEALGYRLIRHNKRLVYRHPCGAQIPVPKSPSDYRSPRNVIAEARRLAGISHTRPKSTTPRGPGRPSRVRTLQGYATRYGYRLTDSQATRLLDRAGNMKAAKQYLTRLASICEALDAWE